MKISVEPSLHDSPYVIKEAEKGEWKLESSASTEFKSDFYNPFTQLLLILKAKGHPNAEEELAAAAEEAKSSEPEKV